MQSSATCPTGLDRGQLMGVANQHGFRPGGGGGGQQVAEIVGADHAGLIDHHQIQMGQLQVSSLTIEGFGDGVAGVAGALADGDVDGFPVAPPPIPGSGSGARRRPTRAWRWSCRPGRRAQRAHQPRRRRNGLDRSFLIRRQPRRVLVFDPQLGPRVAGIDLVEQDGFFGQDAVQREAFMALTLVRRPRERRAACRSRRRRPPPPRAVSVRCRSAAGRRSARPGRRG